MRPRLALVAALAAATPFLSASASAAPDARDCVAALVRAIVLYDPESVTAYPGFVAAQATRFAECMT